MKTHVTPTRNRESLKKTKTIPQLLFGIILIVALGFNALNAQSKTTKITEINVKGMVSDEEGPLTGVNIALEGSNIGAITDTDGTFIFPKALKPNDVLVFSYLGYETKKVKVKADTGFINLQLVAEAIDIVGALAIDKPYKSKRSF